jgi:hypothetical protein
MVSHQALPCRKRSFLDLAKGILPKKSGKICIDRSEHTAVDPARALVADLWRQAIESSSPDAAVHKMRSPAKKDDHTANVPRSGLRRSAIKPQSPRFARFVHAHNAQTHVHAALLYSLGGSESLGHWKSPVMSPSSHSDCRDGPSTATPPKCRLSAGEQAVEALQQQLDQQKADAANANAQPTAQPMAHLRRLSADMYRSARQAGAQRRLSVPPTQVPAEVLAHANERDAQRRDTPSPPPPQTRRLEQAPDPGAQHARAFTPVRDCHAELLLRARSVVTFALPLDLPAGLDHEAAERHETGRNERRGDAVPGAYACAGGRRQTGPPPPHAVQQGGEREQQLD